MSLTEKAAYLKGLADGLNLDENKPETKLILEMINLLDDMSASLADLDDEVGTVVEQLDAVDEDLADLEEFIYDDIDEEDFDDEEDFFEVECPACHETFEVDEEILEDGAIECPNCGENLEFDFDCDCDCDCCDDED